MGHIKKFYSSVVYLEMQLGKKMIILQNYWKSTADVIVWLVVVHMEGISLMTTGE